MPTVMDAARITIRDNAVWRTCTGCTLLAPLTPDVDRCADCTNPAPVDPAADAWRRMNRYAEAIGRIQAWATMPGQVSDGTRLAKIRDALAVLDIELGRGSR